MKQSVVHIRSVECGPHTGKRGGGRGCTDSRREASAVLEAGTRTRRAMGEGPRGGDDRPGLASQGHEEGTGCHPPCRMSTQPPHRLCRGRGIVSRFRHVHFLQWPPQITRTSPSGLLSAAHVQAGAPTCLGILPGLRGPTSLLLQEAYHEPACNGSLSLTCAHMTLTATERYRPHSVFSTEVCTQDKGTLNATPSHAGACGCCAAGSVSREGRTAHTVRERVGEMTRLCRVLEQGSEAASPRMRCCTDS